MFCEWPRKNKEFKKEYRVNLLLLQPINCITSSIFNKELSIKIKTYTRHLNHKTNNKCPKTLQDISNQFRVTEIAFFTVTQLDVQKVNKMMKLCPGWITDSTISEIGLAELLMIPDVFYIATPILFS